MNARWKGLQQGLKRLPSWARCLALSLPLGLTWYLLLYGRYPLYVSHVGWIYTAGGDMLMHQFGWEWWRNEPWRWPLGQIERYGYPFGTSVAFLDAIPLVAIPLRLLSPWLEQPFQYFGLWELVSLIGQVWVSLLLLRQWTRSPWLQALGASLLVLSPPLLFRAFYHSSLSAQWIVLLGIWFVLLEWRGRLWRWAWPLLFLTAVWIHAYFIPILMPLWLVGLFLRASALQLRRWTLLLDGAVVLLVLAGGGAVIGLFGLGLSNSADMGFGVFSWNLNGFFNPLHFASAYLKELPKGSGGQYEGLSYLGLGNLLILPVALYLFLERREWRGRLRLLLGLGAAALVLMLFALSHEAYWGEQLLWKVNLPQTVLQLFGLFRASGRFIWPVFYLLVLFGLGMVLRQLRHPEWVLVVALLVQWADLQPLREMHHQTGFVTYQSPLQSPFWTQAAQTNHHLVIIPARRLKQPQEPLAIYAQQNGLTLNLGYFTRNDAQAFANYATQTWQDLQTGQADAHTLYVLTDEEWAVAAPQDLYRCQVDGFAVVFSAQNPLAAALTPETAALCRSPSP